MSNISSGSTIKTSTESREQYYRKLEAEYLSPETNSHHATDGKTLEIKVVQTCSSCKKEMIPHEGDTIFGENWYHKNCWEKHIS